MWTWSQVVDFIGRHPGEAIALLLVVLMASFIAAGLFLAWWAEREDRRQDLERTRFDRIVRANEPTYTAMAARKHNKPQAAGLKHRRIS